MWYRLAVAKPLYNPIVGGFYVEKENELGKIELIPVEYGKEFSKTYWIKLLNTSQNMLVSQETFNNFLNNPQRFKKDKDGKYIYVKDTRFKPKDLIIPFTFDVYDDELEEYTTLEEGKVFNQAKLIKLLNTTFKNLTSQETFDNFLDNPQRFKKDENGKYIFVKNLLNNAKDLIIPFTLDVYDDEKEEYTTLEEGTVFNKAKLRKLLNTNSRNLYSQETLNNFLYNPQRFKTDKDGKKIYVKHTRNKSKDLIIPFTFDVYDDEKEKYITLEEGKVFSQTKLKEFLNTETRNLYSQETLNNFLYNPQRFKKDENGNLRYKSISISSRESLFYSKFQNYNNDFISVQKQELITISFKNNQNKHITKILKFDFVFKENNQILLAIEINGSQHYGFVPFTSSSTYEKWQNQLYNDVLKINYCHDNNIPLLIFNHMLSDLEFKTILNNLYENPNTYAEYIPQPVIDNNVNNTSIEFVKRQIYSHLYPVFNGTITFNDDASKKRYIKDTLILISKLMGIYEGGIDKSDYIRAFDTNVDLTSNYNICLSIYNTLYPEYPLDLDEKITYSDLSKKTKIYKEKPPVIEPAENLIPSEEDITFEEEE